MKDDDLRTLAILGIDAEMGRLARLREELLPAPPAALAVTAEDKVHWTRRPENRRRMLSNVHRAVAAKAGLTKSRRRKRA